MPTSAVTTGAHSRLASRSSSAAALYFLHSFVTPSASGFTLRLLCRLLEFIAIFTNRVNAKLARDSNLFYLRGRKVECAPTYYPLYEGKGGKGILKAIDSKDGESQKNSVDLKGVAEVAKRGGVFWSVAEYAEAYKQKRVTPLQVAQRIIDVIRESNTVTESRPALLAIISHDQTDLLQQARESTERHKAGKPLSVLDGVPIAIKDEIDVKGYDTNVGTCFISVSPTNDATSVAKLRQAGALLIGKANMHEIGLDTTNCNPWTGTPVNPYNVKHFPGGSSGGSAAAVAAGLCPFAVGADGGGSVRIPSSYCGLYGLKPTAGRISANGAFPLAPTVGVVGPLASSASDMAIAYGLMAGPDEKDVTSLKQPAVSIRVAQIQKVRDLSDIRIGIFRPYFEDAEDEIVDACENFLNQLVARGAKVVDIVLPDLEGLRVAHANTIMSEMTAGTQTCDRSKFSYATRLALLVANNLTAADYVTAARTRTQGMQVLESVFDQVDLIITPTAGVTAPMIPKGARSHGYSDYTTSGKAMRFIFMGNLLGVPGVSVPVGYSSKNNLPIGCQFMSKWWNEELLIRMAFTAEDVLGDKRPKPSLWFDVLGDASKSITI
ncbi:Asp-tRNAAsn/Glu-tRNAGln amidotransferase A subunit and related amidase [Phlyctochytrium arcticum]|nr:Asp-tRNAAsn/Glu-tRNAGln amidotransferase A subunit and related amidase [Phlyctochytrium arcticum]